MGASRLHQPPSACDSGRVEVGSPLECEPFPANTGGRRLGAGLEAQFAEHTADVMLDGLDAEEEPLGDLTVCESRGQQFEDLYAIRVGLRDVRDGDGWPTRDSGVCCSGMGTHKAKGEYPR